MTLEPRAWVLNLDAEHELEASGRYAPTRALAAIVATQSRRLLGDLVLPGDVLVPLEPGDADAEARLRARAKDLVGLAWSPTPRALARLRAVGARPAAAPAVDVLRRANARPFAAEVRAPLALGTFAKDVAVDLETALALLARPAEGGWLVRRSFGAAGRGRRRIARGAPEDAERAWLVASLRRGPLVVEPWVAVTREHTRTGWVDAGAAVHVANPCFQETTDAGAWTRSVAARASEVGRADDARLAEAAAAAGAALARIGYRGPFGIDAFHHRVPGTRREALNPMSEINARFTMDWTTAVPSRPERTDAARLLSPC